MKKTIYIVLMFCCLSTVSCKGFLDKIPTDKLSSDMVYTDPVLAENAVRGVYNNLLWDFNTTDNVVSNWDAYAGVLDPVDYFRGSIVFLSGNVLSTNGVFTTFWKRYYEGINRANDVINNIGNVPGMSEAVKQQRTAECRFIRALYYYRLNCRWRGVPVYFENLAPDEYTKGRSDENTVWEKIIEDCNYCIDNDNLPDRYGASDSNYGRVTKGAAYMLRGKVYLWQKKYELAEADFLKIGEMGYGLYDGNYADLFLEANEKCREMIFSIQYIPQKGFGNALSYIYGNVGTVSKGNDQFVVNTDFADSYQNRNGKPFSWDDIFPGYNNLSPQARSAYFLRDGLNDAEITSLKEYGADMSLYLPSGNEARLKTAYAQRDPRLAATVILPYSTYVGGSTGAALTYTSRYPYRKDTAPELDLQTRYTTRMYYWMRKFVARGTEYQASEYTGIDMPVFRYADVLLCLAEALNEQGRTGEAIAYVNKVRDRAGVAELDSNVWTIVEGQEDLRRRIIDEKHWEFAGESGTLYEDELRWGVWHQRRFLGSEPGVQSEAGLKQVWGEHMAPYIYAGDYCNKWAVPQAERERNGNLSQNDGWN